MAATDAQILQIKHCTSTRSLFSILTAYGLCNLVTQQPTLARSMHSLKPFAEIHHKRSTTVNDFIPKNWIILSRGDGDLNGDNLSDIAMVLHHRSELDYEDIGRFPRVLVVLFKTADGRLEVSVLSDNAVMRADRGQCCPDVGVSVAQTLLTITHSGGGGMYHWSYEHRYQFQSKGWFLIWEAKEHDASQDLADHRIKDPFPNEEGEIYHATEKDFLAGKIYTLLKFHGGNSERRHVLKVRTTKPRKLKSIKEVMF